MLVKIPDLDDFTAEICAIYKNKSMDKRVAEDEMVRQKYNNFLGECKVYFAFKSLTYKF